MKRSAILFFSALLLLSLYNSCKKDDQTNIRNLFTSGTWELASLQVFNYVGDTQGRTDTLNTDCTFKQLFKFNGDNSCTYSNYSCVEQTASGTWSLSKDRLYLISNLVCKDTTAAGSISPFTNTKVISLGQYSMVLQTGDFQQSSQPNKVRRVVQYSFVRQRNK